MRELTEYELAKLKLADNNFRKWLTDTRGIEYLGCEFVNGPWVGEYLLDVSERSYRTETVAVHQLDGALLAKITEFLTREKILGEFYMNFGPYEDTFQHIGVSARVNVHRINGWVEKVWNDGVGFVFFPFSLDWHVAVLDEIENDKKLAAFMKGRIIS